MSEATIVISNALLGLVSRVGKFHLLAFSSLVAVLGDQKTITLFKSVILSGCTLCHFACEQANWATGECKTLDLFVR